MHQFPLQCALILSLGLCASITRYPDLSGRILSNVQGQKTAEGAQVEVGNVDYTDIEVFCLKAGKVLALSPVDVKGNFQL